MKRAVKILLSIMGIILVLAALGILYLTITDYQPDEVEELALENRQEAILQVGQTFTVTTWNIGYAGLGADEDFFMDDGVKAFPDSKEVVEKYMNGVINTIDQSDSDFYFFQEVDLKAKRSYYIDEKEMLDTELSRYSNSFAVNYDVNYVPVPFPPMGKVRGGIATYGRYAIDQVNRYAMPGQYSWPTRVAMLDRCMLESRLPIEGVEQELVLINAHFSAYDDGSIREQQLEFIREYVEKEYEKGNYVVLGGDWNQTFPGVDPENYPLYKDGTFWNPNQIEEDWIAKGWTFAYGDGTETYRLLSAPYEDGVTQVGVIDGFLLSPNVKLVSSEVCDMKFKYSDHNPVRVEVELLD